MPIVYVYAYNGKTKEYIHNAEPAQVDPLEPDNLLIPAHATTIAPPEVGEKEVAVFDEAACEWQVKADRRGEVYYDTKMREKITIDEIGVTPKKTWTAQAPNDPEEVWTGKAWEVPFAILVERKKAEIASARYDSATGIITIDEHRYLIDKDSQIAFSGKLLAFQMGAITETRWKAVDGFVDLTAAEFLFITKVIQAYIDACFVAESGLAATVNAATTPGELAAINWEAPNVEEVIAALPA